jgi:hypothetical protein
MTRIETCIECQHLEKANTEYPCVNCRKNAKNNFVPIEKIKLHDLTVSIQKVANQEMQISTHWTVEKLIKTIDSLTIGQ